jgi:hypothetical protein
VESSLSVTGTSAVGQIVANSGADGLPHPIQRQRGPASAAAAPAENVPKLEALAPPAFGLVLYYDPDMQRLILEARDPLSGFVILQVPQKYVMEQFATLGASAERMRGKGVDSAV